MDSIYNIFFINIMANINIIYIYHGIAIYQFIYRQSRFNAFCFFNIKFCSQGCSTKMQEKTAIILLQRCTAYKEI